MGPNRNIVDPGDGGETAPVSVDCRREGASAVVVLAGEVDLEGGDAVEDAVAALVDDGVTDISVDARQVTFLDSSGLGGLLAAKVRAEGAGGRLQLGPVPDNVARVIELAGVTEMFAPD
ncbi:MAG TPA: STAS domain-containing protein [Acidimicrobiales bacterium]